MDEVRHLVVERIRKPGTEVVELAPMEQVNHLMALCMEWKRKDGTLGPDRPGLQRSVVQFSRR